MKQKDKKPRVIALLSQKGGSGKTTLAVHLSVCAMEAGERAAIIDVDPQASAYAWCGFRPENQGPAVAVCRPDQVEEYIETGQRTGLSLIVLDTPPHATTALYDVVSRADFLVMPCRASILDLSAIDATVKVAEASKKPGAFVLTGIPPRSPEVVATRKALESYPYRIAPQTIGHRQAYVRALASGKAVTEFEPASQAAEETRQLWKWIEGQL
jgi:chromosome partitioning protein